MLGYILRRILQMIPVLLGVSIIVFMLSYLVPGDPVMYFLPADATHEEYLRIYQALGLDKPVLDQYWNFISHAVVGDFGVSFRNDEPVAPLIMSRLPNTIRLAIAAMLISIAISIPIGVYAATHHNRIGDYFTMFSAIFGVSMPGFWLGIILILFFAVFLGVLPTSGLNYTGDPQDWDINHLLLPALTMGLTSAAATARLTRSSVLETMGTDYIRTARAKGVGKRRVVWVHALRNALIPVMTMLGLQFAHELGGAMVIEVVFAYPGVGRLTYDAIMTQDYYLLQGCVFLIAVLFVVLNLVVDILYSYVDPRISYGG